ncbi:MAG: argininosuccinate lyase, partial [Ancalomicrobiaceae bacterium]|nr:argininosuccinate lyase [Ancalomicrobiaceae bacterium]
GAVQRTIDAGFDAGGMTVDTINAAALQEIGRPLALTPDFVRNCLDPQQSVWSRTTPGGTAPSEVPRMLAVLRTKLARDTGVVRQRASNLEIADSRLRNAVQAIAA